VAQVSDPRDDQPYLELSEDYPDEGEEVFVISTPEGLEGVVSPGIVSALHNSIDLQISCPISSGSSGGPVFNFYGEVVGIVNGFLTVGQNLNFAIAARHLRKLLSEWAEEVNKQLQVQHQSRLQNLSQEEEDEEMPREDYPSLHEWVQLQKRNNTTWWTPVQKIFLGIKHYTNQILSYSTTSSHEQQQQQQQQKQKQKQLEPKSKWGRHCQKK